VEVWGGGGVPVTMELEEGVGEDMTTVTVSSTAGTQGIIWAMLRCTSYFLGSNISNNLSH